MLIVPYFDMKRYLNNIQMEEIYGTLLVTLGWLGCIRGILTSQWILWANYVSCTDHILHGL